MLQPENDILLAEDDIEDADIFSVAMNELKCPYTLRHAKNGDVLFVLLKERMPYILFLDIDMPCKNGIACIVEIRKNKAYDKLPIVMYTSHLAEQIIEESFRCGANMYLTKTGTFSELTEKLRKVFYIDWANYLHYPPREQFVLS